MSSILEAVVAPGLMRAAAVFLLMVFAAWGLGDLVVATLRVSRARESRITRPLLSLALGCGALGEGLFVAGALGDAYRAPVIDAVLMALAVLAAFRLPVRGWAAWLRPPQRLGRAGWIVVGVVVVFVAQWGYVSLGFNPGSDVFSHHYVDVKAMIRARHFTYALHLPSLHAHVSSYNPALVRMLWLPGMLLADERAANMFHWLTQIMLLGGIYVFGRNLFSARAGLFAVACYLSTGMMGYYPLEAQDYTLMAMFMVLAMYFLVAGARERDIRLLGVAGLLAGCMLASKYYALPLAALMAAAIICWDPATWFKRLRGGAVFAAAAGVVYAPWLLYNSVVFHDPFFPRSLQNDEIGFFRATYWVHALTPFVARSDHGFLLPTLSYYSSLFVPFDPPSAPFGLSVMFLIGLPCSGYALWRGRGEPWRIVNVLFLLSLVSFIALHELVGHSAFYKWAFFPAVLYVCSLGICVELLRPRATRLFWVATGATICLNYWFVVQPRMRAIIPPVAEQRQRWDDLTRYLNVTLERDAVVSGTFGTSTYYLRADVTGMVEDEIASTDWRAEEASMRRVGVTHVIVAPQHQEANDELFSRWSGLWRQLSPADPSAAMYIEDVRRRNAERNRAKAEYLKVHGTLLHAFADGCLLYRVY